VDSAVTIVVSGIAFLLALETFISAMFGFVRSRG
jgi:hypothetical protein